MVLWFSLFRPLFLIFFFFQAQDGIRDATVTGVQTCALPILSVTHSRQDQPRLHPQRRNRPSKPSWDLKKCMLCRLLRSRLTHLSDSGSRRSEERRVGKECRYGGRGGGEKREESGTVRRSESR